LLRATANQTGERVSAARARVEERMREAKAAVDELQDDDWCKGRSAQTRATDSEIDRRTGIPTLLAAVPGQFRGQSTECRGAPAINVT